MKPNNEDKKKQKNARKSVQVTNDKKLESASSVKKRKTEADPSLSKKLEGINLNELIKVKKLFSLSQAGKSEDQQRKVNQDSYLVMEKINKCETFNLFAVMDGHGPNGHLVSQFVTKYVNSKINSNKKLDGVTDEEEIYAILKKNNYEIIRHLFTHGEKEILKSGTIDANFSGTTCVMVIQIGNRLIIANVGDSRAIMCTQNGLCPLSKDQKPDDEEEKKRIIKAGGEISQYEEDGEKSGPFRVWQKGQPYPGIAMSRSIGDFIASSLGVISEPVITEQTLDETKFIVLASDGVWEFLDSNKVMNMVQPYYEKNDPDNACKLLIKESTTWWENEDVVIDDITCIVVFY